MDQLSPKTMLGRLPANAEEILRTLTPSIASHPLLGTVTSGTALYGFLPTNPLTFAIFKRYQEQYMSTKGEVLYHPVNGSTEQTWDGFSWPGFFFSGIWLLIKGLYGQFVIFWLVVLVTAGIAAPVLWIVYACMGNKLHKNALMKKGYLTEHQWQTKPHSQQPTVVVSSTPAPVHPPLSSQKDTVTQLRELADLKAAGVLTEDEFHQQKAKLLNA
ncbi:SHOCT domain-containing protein [Pseudomonas monteilii]